MYYPVTLVLGVSLLLGGLFTMRYGLRKVFSLKLRLILSKLTMTPWRGMLAGTAAAALMQSSTALTLVTVALVSAEYLSFYQGLGLILGANIGTCSTVQLLQLSIPLDILMPAMLITGIAGLVRKLRPLSLAVCGMLGMFAGVSLLSEAMGSVAEFDTVVRYLAAGHNPLYGIGGGILLTFLFQSSSAATGLLMVLAAEGIIDLSTAAYGVYGNNIGSCLSSLVVGATAPLAAKRVALSHIVLNVLGVLIFLPLTGQLTKIATLFTTDFGGQVAMIHTLFNVISSLAVLPVIRPYARLISFLVPGNGYRG